MIGGESKLTGQTFFSEMVAVLSQVVGRISNACSMLVWYFRNIMSTLEHTRTTSSLGIAQESIIILSLIKRCLINVYFIISWVYSHHLNIDNQTLDFIVSDYESHRLQKYQTQDLTSTFYESCSQAIKSVRRYSEVATMPISEMSPLNILVQ